MSFTVGSVHCIALISYRVKQLKSDIRRIFYCKRIAGVGAVGSRHEQTERHLQKFGHFAKNIGIGTRQGFLYTHS